jgi:hypothetical protein
LSFSLDTLVFDTVFTTIGSTTQQFKIYNNENKTLNIEEIELMGGANSFFRMNVDGISQNIIKDIIFTLCKQILIDSLQILK